MNSALIGVTRALARLLSVALLAAALTSLGGWPWSTRSGLGLTEALLILPALLCALLLARAERPAARIWDALHDWLGRRFGLGFGRLLFLLTLWAALVPTGWWWSIRHVVDVPFGAHALGAYLASVIVATLIVLAAAWLLSSPPRTRRPWSASVWLLIGFLGAFADGFVLPREQLEYHFTILPLTLFAFTVAAYRAPRLARALGPIVFAALLLLGGRPDYSAIAVTRSSHQHVLRIARWLVDGDGDGHSPILGGGDCDDHDATAYGLSLVGRDCTGWMPPTASSPSPAPALVVAPSAPKTILLLTIDAFRCGFHHDQRPELLAECPVINQLGQDGWSRDDVHTSYASTPFAVPILHTGDLHAEPDHLNPNAVYLASTLSRAGYRGLAISTHWNVLRNRGVRASFDDLDETLVPIAKIPERITSELVTDRVLRALDQKPDRAFIWAHYYDPHAAYLLEPGDEVEISPITAYRAELRRTDAAIGRLMGELKKRADADGIVVVLTADHGEEFGEHDTAYHGASLYEADVHVPLVVWSPGKNPRQFGNSELPLSTSQLGAYLLALVSGAPFSSAKFAIMQSDAFEDPLVGVYANGWKLIYHRGLNVSELYDLSRDPFERQDLAHDDPARVTELGRLIGAAWKR